MLPAFVINLDRRPDRWAAVSGNLSALGIVPERIGATDADRVMGAIPDDLSLSQAACRESHFAAPDAFLQTGAPAALILEDDAELAPGACGLLASADWWPAAFHAVKLGGCDEPALLGQAGGQDAVRRRNPPCRMGVPGGQRLHDRPRRRGDRDRRGAARRNGGGLVPVRHDRLAGGAAPETGSYRSRHGAGKAGAGVGHMPRVLAARDRPRDADRLQGRRLAAAHDGAGPAGPARSSTAPGSAGIEHDPFGLKQCRSYSLNRRPGPRAGAHLRLSTPLQPVENRLSR